MQYEVDSYGHDTNWQQQVDQARYEHQQSQDHEDKESYLS